MATLKVPGRKVRTLRRHAGLSQADLAQRLGISASYLNLIEHERRTLTAGLLVKLAQVLDLDLRSIASSLDARVLQDLEEVFADPLFEGSGPADAEIRDLAISSPEVARAIARLHQAYAAAQASARTLATQVLDRQDVPGMPTAELSTYQVTVLLVINSNHFTELKVTH